MIAEVVPLKSAYDVIRREYRNHQVTFRLDKERKVWSWHFIHTSHTGFGGTDCPSLDDAIKRAYKNIDIIVG